METGSNTAKKKTEDQVEGSGDGWYKDDEGKANKIPCKDGRKTLRKK